MSDTPDSNAQRLRPLSLRQQRFVHEYLVDGNAAAAARRAGYEVKRAKSYGCEMLKKPAVRAAVEAERAARAAPMTREAAIEALRRIASANVLDYARPGPDGALELDLWRLERDRAGAVRELTVTERTDPKTGAVTRTVGFKLADRSAALIKLLPMLGSEAVEKAMDKGYAEGVETTLDLEVEQFMRMKAYRDELCAARPLKRARSGVELARRNHDFWFRERSVKDVDDWEVMSDAEFDAMEAEGDAEREARA